MLHLVSEVTLAKEEKLKVLPFAGHRGDGRFSPSEADALATLRALVEHLDAAELSVPLMRALLLIATSEAGTVGDYAKAADVAQPVMTHWIMELGPRKRNGRAGLGLVEMGFDPSDMRKHIVRLTTRGHSKVKQLLRVAKGASP